MLKTKKYLNIACGETFINDAFWQNINFVTKHSNVKNNFSLFLQN
ncbi:hypothetical protein N8803_00045 [Gammaproteobacteria bacterium]|nr:hypothetical protein [Gammaproteobacteria bacterium]